MSDRRHTFLCAIAACALLALCVPAGASSQELTGGSVYVPPPPPAKRAKIVNGVAIPPAGAPARVKRAIEAANLIVRKPYVYGGGHKPYLKRKLAMIAANLDSGYDCSGTVSFALFGGRFLKSPLDSGSFMSWGLPGKGRWITVYTNPGHAYLVGAGLRLDTGFRSNRVRGTHPGRGPRWDVPRPTKGFAVRHPAGL